MIIKDINERDKHLACPFCRLSLEGPSEISLPFGSKAEGGKCQCGAVYIYDRSGRMTGEAFSDALLLAYEGDYDKAFGADDEDYEEVTVSHARDRGRYVTGEPSLNDRNPKFYFIRLKRV